MIDSIFITIDNNYKLNEINKISNNVTVLKSKPHPKGSVYGCYDSHLKALYIAIKLFDKYNVDKILIVEDVRGSKHT